LEAWFSIWENPACCPRGSARNPDERSKRKEKSKSQNQMLEPQVLKVLL
jgi:hypothetical protein